MEASEAEIDLRTTDVADLEQQLRESFPGAVLIPRDHFRLRSDYVDWMVSGRKRTTIRIKHAGIDYPTDNSLPLESVPEFASETGRSVGRVHICRLRVKPFRDLTVDDARADGFTTREELTDALLEIYGPQCRSDLVTIYEGFVISGRQQAADGKR